MTAVLSAVKATGGAASSVKTASAANPIIAGVVVATGLTVIRQLIDSKLSMRPILSGFIVGTMLLTLGFFSSAIASALALLLLVSSVLTNGVPILEKVMGYSA